MIKPKKSLGQNFLIDKNISKKIVNLTIIKDKEVIEVGPGTGILTDEIINKNPKKLTLIEKDTSLYQILKKKYKKNTNIEIFNSDAINYNFKKYKRPQLIISNLPYNISIKLIIKWLKMTNQISEMILMIQKEVADKMNYINSLKKNRLNFFMEITSDFNIEFTVSKNVFFPKPKIMSSVIKILPKNNDNIDLDKIEMFTREIFKHRRKKLSNVLNLNKEKINKISKSVLEKRAEDLTSKELLDIFNQFYNF